jgi:hypothetical protein
LQSPWPSNQSARPDNPAGRIVERFALRKVRRHDRRTFMVTQTRYCGSANT